MFSIFKKLFGKPQPKAVKAVKAVKVAKAYAAPQSLEPTAPIPSVEVAHLSLAVIINCLPDDIKTLVRQAPTETATVALPVPTIMKQLATGCVKMSLQSLHRQAHGVFAPLAAGDKRTVEVPLAEIFRHVSPHSLRRRPDQRMVKLPENGFNLFGNAENPYEIAPTVPEDEPPADSTVLDLTPEAPRALKMDDGLRNKLAPGARPRATPAAKPAPAAKAATAAGIKAPRAVAARPGTGGACLASAAGRAPAKGRRAACSAAAGTTFQQLARRGSRRTRGIARIRSSYRCPSRPSF